MFKAISDYYNTPIDSLYKMKGVDILNMYEVLLQNQKE